MYINNTKIYKSITYDITKSHQPRAALNFIIRLYNQKYQKSYNILIDLLNKYVKFSTKKKRPLWISTKKNQKVFTARRWNMYDAQL